ncbi:hypothetical protein [Hydrogenovibrio sp. JE_KL2]|jgi:methyl-accepting chemotaxis protein|uniref:hypothetical protein n=1 Tax=Hydrogenovibrio sp. JE_KL2 TaxID=2651188 RepID=UPI00128B0BCD|nr:hypothetical protein [Hydrogenovibrio sp. JE_KL2]MBD3822620.1 hypothetical protein [Thiotrichales bacterium]MBN2606516.1 hypothetical protein [Thiotrichales bacterium]MPQ77206.1 hypothetical protein [Hydrogenovibrio sp. JE_KL2]
MNKLFLLIILVIFGVLSIAFNWFDSRDTVNKLLNKAQETNETIQQTGDKMSGVVDQIQDVKKAVEK